jgi:hypothetical protein
MFANAFSTYLSQESKANEDRRNLRVEAYTKFAESQAVNQTFFAQLDDLLYELNRLPVLAGRTAERSPDQDKNRVSYARVLINLISDTDIKKHYTDRLTKIMNTSDVANANFQNSVFRIGIYGDSAVVKSIANYRRLYLHRGAPCSSGREQSFMDAANYQSIRRDAVGNDANQKVSDEDIISLVFGCEIPPAAP